ncbi:MAG: PRD domain-containing protein [Chloroflexota bacterium]
MELNAGVEFRLRLLGDSGQVDRDSLAACRRVIKAVEERYRITVGEDNGGMFVTHLAVALARLRAGQPVTEIPPVAVAEAREHVAIWQFIADTAGAAAASLGAALPESEVAFLTLHLAALLEGSDAGA